MPIAVIVAAVPVDVEFITHLGVKVTETLTLPVLVWALAFIQNALVTASMLAVRIFFMMNFQLSQELMGYLSCKRMYSTVKGYPAQAKKCTKSTTWGDFLI